jgi:hypothetical protein
MQLGVVIMCEYVREMYWTCERGDGQQFGGGVMKRWGGSSKRGGENMRANGNSVEMFGL